MKEKRIAHIRITVCDILHPSSCVSNSCNVPINPLLGQENHIQTRVQSPHVIISSTIFAPSTDRVLATSINPKSCLDAKVEAFDLLRS